MENKTNNPVAVEERLYRWVKITEKLPEKINKPLPAKMENQYGVVTIFGTHIEFSGRGHFQTFHEHRGNDFNSLFWLEPIPIKEHPY